MAKKRKNVQIINDIDTSIVKEKTEKPKCFNSKKPYCIKDLCVNYYDSCRTEEDEVI